MDKHLAQKQACAQQIAGAVLLFPEKDPANSLAVTKHRPFSKESL